MSLISLKRLLGLIFVSLLLNSTTLAADGKSIFKAKCAVCHSLGDNRGTGPGLKGVSGRIKDKNIAYQWVQNVDTHKGDAYFANLIKDYGQLMSNFQSELNADEVKAVVDYIYSEPGDGKDKGPKVASTTGDVQVENANAGFDPLYLILGAIAILAILIGIFRSIRAAMHNQALRAAGKPIVDEDTTFWDEAKQWMRGHRKLMGVFVILLVLIGMRGCWNGLFDLGVYANPETGEYYSPEQPIKFSHKIHAGDNAIACQYCHNTVEKSKHAGIPTVNVCMNCHKGIQEGPITGKTEIAKIHKAAGFDPATGKYDESKSSPIKWIKVHNLPDHVYFNHSQHVVVGKQECNACHGEVKEFTVGRQVMPLTMGWCIDCHRKTNVAMEGNAYYEKLHAALKEKYKGNSKRQYTVAEAGGIECAKCHY